MINQDFKNLVAWRDMNKLLMKTRIAKAENMINPTYKDLAKINVLIAKARNEYHTAQYYINEIIMSHAMKKVES